MTYFWKKNEDMYHWHLQCSQIPIYVRRSPDWVVTEQMPKDKIQCKECREKDVKDKLAPRIK